MTTESEITKEHAASIKATHLGVKINGILKSLSETSSVSISLWVIFIFVIHLYLALSFCDFSWVASFGALLSVFSILLIASESLFSNFETDKMNIYLNERPDYVSTFGSGGFSELIPENNIDSELENRRKQFNIKYKNIGLYLTMSIIGTLIWAYSGFLNELF